MFNSLDVDIKKSGIYKITNIITNKFYIGSAKSFYRRWVKHRSALNLNKHGNDYFQNAWNKYGENNFKFQIIEIVDDITKLVEREQYYLDLYKPYDKNIGYNILISANNMLGYKPTEETLKKLSKAKSGSNHPMFGKKTPEHVKEKLRNSLSGKNNPNYGKTTPDNVREKISKSNIGKKLSVEHRNKLISANTGRIPTEETRKKLSNANKGKIYTDSIKKNISLGILSKRMTKDELINVEKNIVEIRNKYATGKFSCKMLANEYNFGETTIRRIVKLETWKNV